MCLDETKKTELNLHWLYSPVNCRMRQQTWNEPHFITKIRESKVILIIQKKWWDFSRNQCF